MTTEGGLRKRTRQGTFIPRAVLRDRSLSFRARGLLAHLLDRPAGWDVRAESLARESEHDGRDSILTALRELGAAGYYRLERRQLGNGQFAMGTAISEDPIKEWAADHAEYGGRAVPVIQQPGGSYLVRHKDGTTTPDGFPADHHDPDESDETDEDASSQVRPETGFPAPVEPASVEPAPGSTGSGKPGAISKELESKKNREVSFRTEPTTSSQYGRAAETGGTNAAAKKPRSRAERSEAEQARWDEADEIARTWWESWKARGITIVGNKFPGFRQNTVLAALKAGADPEHVRRALVACNEPFPSLARFQRELAAIQSPASIQSRTGGHGRGQPSNVWHDPGMGQEEHERLADLFEGVSVNGKRIE